MHAGKPMTWKHASLLEKACSPVLCLRSPREEDRASEYVTCDGDLRLYQPPPDPSVAKYTTQGKAEHADVHSLASRVHCHFSST